MIRNTLLKSVNKNGVRWLVKRFQSTESTLLSFGKKSLIFNETEGFVMKSPFDSISIPEMTIDQYVWKDVSKWQNHIAIECGVTGRNYTYAKLRDHCAALAIRMRKQLNLQQKDKVAICLPNVPGNFEYCFQCSLKIDEREKSTQR